MSRVAEKTIINESEFENAQDLLKAAGDRVAGAYGLAYLLDHYFASRAATGDLHPTVPDSISALVGSLEKIGSDLNNVEDAIGRIISEHTKTSITSPTKRRPNK